VVCLSCVYMASGRILHLAPRAAFAVDEPATPGSVAVLADYAGQLTQCTSGCEPDMWSPSLARLRPVGDGSGSGGSSSSLVPEHVSQEENMSRSINLPTSSAAAAYASDDSSSASDSLHLNILLNPDLKATPEAAFVLVDHLPQQAYARIKVRPPLCQCGPRLLSFCCQLFVGVDIIAYACRLDLIFLPSTMSMVIMDSCSLPKHDNLTYPMIVFHFHCLTFCKSLFSMTLYFSQPHSPSFQCYL
jgi:hypothetical protein